jgi:hypothetical protein
MTSENPVGPLIDPFREPALGAEVVNLSIAIAVLFTVPTDALEGA